MENSEYDERQLKLMYGSLVSYERKLIHLNSLVGTLHFLVWALESVEEDWSGKFFEEISTLETINALAIIKEAGENINPEMEKHEAEAAVNNSVSNVKKIIEERLVRYNQSELNEEIERLLKR